MNNRERLMAIMARKSPDRIPWIARLEVWHKAHTLLGTLPEKYTGWSLPEIERDLGLDRSAREGRVFRTELHGVEVQSEERGDGTVTEYITPVGTVSTLQRRSAELERLGIVGLEVEHMIKGPGDYRVVEYLIEHTEVIPTYDQYRAYDEEIGEESLPIVFIGQDPMTRILQELIGYKDAYFHLRDCRDRLIHLLRVLQEQAAEVQQVVLDSPAMLILHGGNYDSQMTPPYLFEEYIVPYFRPFADRLHERGKFLACHADADTRLLLHLIKAAGFDMVDCFATAPMVSVTLQDARAVFGNDVIVWGGIPSVVLTDTFTDEEFQRYLLRLFHTIAPGDAFILGVSDCVMPGDKLERVARVSEMVREYGSYPIQLS